MLTGSNDTTAILWDRGSGAIVRTFAGHSGQIHSVYISSDARYVVTGSSDNTVILWNVATGSIVWTFSGHTGQVFSVYISIDMRYILTGSSDGTAVLLNFENGETVRTFAGHTGGILSVAISQNLTYVVTASQDSTVILWNLATGAVVWTFDGHQGGVLSIFISADSRYICTGSDDGTAKLLDVATGVVVRTFTSFTGPNANLVNSVSISHDSRFVVTGCRDVGTVVIFDLETGVEVWTQKGTVLSIGISVDNRFILTGSSDTTAKLYEPTVTIINGNNYCKPSERGLAVEPSDGCLVLPGLQSLPGAVVNSDFYTFDGDTIVIAVAAVPSVHVIDGRFGDNEWNHITPAIGRYTNLYVDYIDGIVYICSDWIFNTVAPVQDDFYALFTVVSGGGQQIWSIRVYGNNRVEVELNGVAPLVGQDVVTGASGFDVSPRAPVQNHTIFEVAFAPLPGNFSVVLHAPGPRFDGDVLETEVVTFVGNVDEDGGGFIKTNVPPEEIPIFDGSTTTPPDVDASEDEEDDRVPLWPLWVVLVLLCCCCCPLFFFCLFCCRPRLMVLTFTGATPEVLDWERDPRMALEPEELHHLEAITLERLVEIGTKKLGDDDDGGDGKRDKQVIIDVGTSTVDNGEDVEKGASTNDDVARMTIFVKLKNGKTIACFVDPSDTIEIVKAKIQEIQEIQDLAPGQSAGQQEGPLFFDGKQLENDRTLLYYNVQRDATLSEDAGESIVKRRDFRRSTVLKEKDDDEDDDEDENKAPASYSIPVVGKEHASPGGNGVSRALPAVDDETVKAHTIEEVADGVDADIISRNHELMAGDFVFVSGVTGESAAAFNGRRRVTFVDGDAFKINANGDNAIGGGEASVLKLSVIRVEVSYKWYVWGVFDVMLSLVLQTIRRAEPECAIVSVPGKTLMLKDAVQTRMAGSPYARMKIFVKLKNGKTITCFVDPSDTIEIVKAKIQEIQEIQDLAPGQEQEPLFFESKQLENDRTLLYYNVQRDASLSETLDGNPAASAFANPVYDSNYEEALKTAVAATPEQFGGFDAEDADGYLEVGDAVESPKSPSPYGADDDEASYDADGGSGGVDSAVVPDATYGAPAPVEDTPPEDAAYYQTQAETNADGAQAEDDTGYMAMTLGAGAAGAADEAGAAGAADEAGAAAGGNIDL